LAEEMLDRESVTNEGGVALDLDRFQKFSRGLQKSVLRRSLSRIKGNLQSISAKDLDRILGLIQENKSGRCVRIGDVRIRREYHRLYLERIEAEREEDFNYSYRLPIPGQLELTEARTFFRASIEADLFPGSADGWRFYLSTEEAKSGVWVRNWRGGDAYRPLGASRIKKVKELFSQKKIPLHLRSAWPVVGIDDKIIFAKGFPVSADRSVKEASKRNLKVVIEERNLESETGSSLI